ncbi:MAG: maleylpyruvate isomerase family mycothiol-dependent enzyme [Arachnia sp.]
MMKQRSSDIWPAVHLERRTLVRDLSSLTPSDWGTPSLCPGWDIHDVVAHIVDTAKTTRLGFVRRMLAVRFDFDRDNAEGVARERAASPQDTLAALEEVLTRSTTPPAPLATRLVEMFVHGEDIRRPLGISRTYPPALVAEALAYQVATGTNMGGGKELARGWRLVASDTEFVYGTGPEVRGEAISLLLAVSGRPVGPDELTGAGSQHFVAGTTTAS